MPLTDADECVDRDQSRSIDQAWEAAWVEHHYELAMRSLRSHCEPKSLEVFNGLLAGQEIRALACKYDMTEDAVRRTRVRIREQLRGLIAEQIRKDGEGYERRATFCAAI